MYAIVEEMRAELEEQNCTWGADSEGEHMAFAVLEQDSSDSLSFSDYLAHWIP